MTIPAPCSAAGCTNVETTAAPYFKTISCTTMGGSCVCPFTAEIATTGNPPYTVAGNQFTTDPGTGSSRTYDYCIAASKLTYRELGTQPRDPGVFVMDKK